MPLTSVLVLEGSGCTGTSTIHEMNIAGCEIRPFNMSLCKNEMELIEGYLDLVSACAHKSDTRVSLDALAEFCRLRSCVRSIAVPLDLQKRMALAEEQVRSSPMLMVRIALALEQLERADASEVPASATALS